MSRRWVVVGLLFAGMLVSYVDRGNLSIAASSIMRDFRLTPAVMGMLLSAFFWTYGGFQLPAGAFVDRIGIKRVYAVAFLLWSMASAGIALTRGSTDILALRLVLGLAESVGPIASLAFIRRNFAGPEQGLPTAIYIAAQNMGPALGTLLGTVLLESLGWRFMFAATGLGALVWLPCWLLLAPPDEPKAVPANRPKLAPPSLPWGSIIAGRAFWAMSAAIFLSSYFWYFLLTWVPAYLTLSRGFSTLEMGRVLSLPLFVMAVLNVMGGSIADRIARRTGSVFRVRVAFAIAAYTGASTLLLLLVLPGRAAVLPVLLISVSCVGVGNSNYWSIAQHVPPAHMVGRTIGYLNTLSQIAGAAAPLITGWILGPEKQFGVALAIAGICPVLAALCLWIVGPKGLDAAKRTMADSLDQEITV
jgi:MFS family permease